MKQLKSVLLIEDDEDDQWFFIEAIKDISNVSLYHVANNGSAALDKLKNSAILPDIIFSDINMPLMNGIECFLEIIKTPRTRHIPVVFISSDTSKKELVYKLGAKAFIEKKSDKQTLSELLKQIV